MYNKQTNKDVIYSSERLLVNIIVWNVHAPSEEKSDYSNFSFYEELEQVSIIFLSTVLDPVRRF